MLQATIRRLESLPHVGPAIVVCGKHHERLVTEQLGDLGVTPGVILVEPEARGTAAAAASATHEALVDGNAGRDPVLLILPADHFIEERGQFQIAVQHASQEAKAGKLVTFGIVPTRPDTEYGYIRPGAPTGVSKSARFVDRFVEKPDAKEAQSYLGDDGYVWNSGIFVFLASTYLRELNLHTKEVADAAGAAHRLAVRSSGVVRLDAESLSRSPVVSIDNAVMEHTSQAVVTPLEAGWLDMGSWQSLAKLTDSDAAGNTVVGDVVLEGVTNTSVFGATRLVALAGVRDLVVVDTADALLVAGAGADRDIKKLVQKIDSAGRSECQVDWNVKGPWGSAVLLHRDSGLNIWRFIVNPGGRAALLTRPHSADQWIVLRGAARVTHGSETRVLTNKESVYIPRGRLRQLDNPGAAAVELLCIQFTHDDWRPS